MKQTGSVDPTYVWGRSDEEMTRLRRQAKFAEHATRRLFEDAGITTGMKVPDLGSGAGDVAFLAADLVGPTGRVVGVDLNPSLVEGGGRPSAGGQSEPGIVRRRRRP
jgi:SAM-dependent methyltransferase